MAGGDRQDLAPSVLLARGTHPCLHAVPLGWVGGGSGEGVTGRLQELPALFWSWVQARWFYRVGAFDATADRVIQLTDVKRQHLLLPLPPWPAHRPLHSLAGTDLRLPASGDLGEVMVQRNVVPEPSAVGSQTIGAAGLRPGFAS